MTKQYDIESTNIEGLLPRQLISDSAALIDFLKEYYRFLNQDDGPSQIINNIISNRDLDEAVESFIALIRRELGQSMVNDLVADKINLYKHITEFYNSRGSLDSFRTLFRLLFNTEIEISLPKEKILVASDGRWVQQTSFFIDVSAGNVFALYAQIINLTNPITGAITTVEIERIRQVDASTVYEVYIRKSVLLAQISVGDTVNYLGVEGTVISSLNDYEIVHGGTGFKVGQYIDIVDPAVNLPAKIKVTRVLDGGVTKFEFIRFNGGYADTEQYMVVAEDNIVGGVDLIASTDPDQEKIDYPDRAIVKFTSSAIALYAGSYINNKGFLSDDIYLQDNFFYQPYSYQIKSGQLFTAYKNILNQTVHPAGMIAFGAFEINNSFDLSRQLSSITRYFQSRYYEEAVDTSDEAVITFVKVVADLVSTGDIQVISYNKQLTSEITVLELLSFDYSKSITGDSVTSSDDQIIAVDKSLADTVYSIELLNFNINKPLSDDINSIDSGTIELNDESYSIGYFASDYVVGTSQFN